MKTLIEYLENAKHYLYELSASELMTQRQLAIDYCKARRLEENFLKQVERTPDWVKLAENSEVRFYIEEPLKQNPGSTRNAFVETGIFLRVFDGGKTPVIKVVM